jgi:Fur family ferric uptake transcriptional regulator
MTIPMSRSFIGAAPRSTTASRSLRSTGTVKLFEDAGIIERHDFRNGRARYEQMPDSHHDHLIDLRTGEVIEFTSEDIERLQAEVARRLGYRLVDHRLELYALPLDDKPRR